MPKRKSKRKRKKKSSLYDNSGRFVVSLIAAENKYYYSFV